MTKAELESWYKANMVGSTGGGGGVTSGEVQTMIDESISGKANSSDVYTTGQTSGATEIANALNAKLDATAYTPTVVDAALSQSSTNPVQNQALYGELRVGGGTSKVEIDFNTGGYVPEGVTQLEVNPTTTDSWATYNFYNGNTRLGYYSFTNWGSFSVGNSLEGSSYVISGETVIITYPASLGVTRIAQDGGNEPWSFEAIVETPAVPLKDVVSGIEPKVNSAWTKSIRDLFWYPTTSGLTLEYSILSGGTYQFAVQPMDESLRYGENASGVNKYLGVYASGNTYNLLVNKYNNTVGGYRITFPMAYKASKVTLQLNSAYTGQTPTTNAIQAYYVDNRGINYNPKWNYNSGTDSFTNSTEYTGIALAYDQITKIVTLTLDSSYNYIIGVRTAKNFADENDLTNPSYYIGAVTIDSNLYKLQEALDNKQDTLSAGTGISISGNVISATGGGSLNIPISAGTGTYSIQENTGTALGDYSHAEGSNTTAYGDYSHAEGYNTMAISAYSHTEGWQTQANGLAAHAEGYTTHADGEKSHAEGNITETKNLGEHASGSYNLSHKASNTFGDSGNTLFSVGNGTSTGTSRHNAFEIRQNGDIYFEYDGADTKLQDKLDEIETVTAAALNNLNDRIAALEAIIQNMNN